MKKYVGTKQIVAKPMNRGEYNQYRGWQIPVDENPEDEGYLVKYSDGYESWSPVEQFEKAYRECDNMTFGLAIEEMKKGKRVARKGWNGKGMFIYYVPSAKYKAMTNIAKSIADENGMVQYNSYMAIKNVDGTISTWVASVNDTLSEDWMVVE